MEETREIRGALLDGREAAALIPHLRADAPQVVLAVGRRGMGKTTLIRHYSARLEPRRLTLDFRGDFPGGFEYEADWRDGIERLRDNPRAEWVRLFQPPRVSSEEWGNAIFSTLADVDPKVFAWDMLLVIDEISRYSPEKKDSALKQLLLQGRGYGIRFLIASQRMVDVPAYMRSEVTELAAFQMRNPADRDRLTDWTEDGAGDAVAGLPKHLCQLWSPL